MRSSIFHQGHYDFAIKTIKDGLKGVHASDATMLLTLAEAYFRKGDFTNAINTFEELRADNPNWYKAEAHLIFARSLEGAGRQVEALEEYRALADRYPGQEARFRYACLLAIMGRKNEARAIAEELIMTVERGSRAYKNAQREWCDAAKELLAN